MTAPAVSHSDPVTVASKPIIAKDAKMGAVRLPSLIAAKAQIIYIKIAEMLDNTANFSN